MKYMGSKNRIAKFILPIILKDRKEGQWYVEPFVGGANMIDKVDGKRLGSDVNKYLIALLKEMQKDRFEAPDVSEDIFNKIKNNKEKYSDWLVGYVGFQLSYGAMWFGSYRRDSKGIRNYSHEAMRNVNKQSKLIRNIVFKNCEYHEIEIPENSIIYCDPPYRNTAKYKANKKDFNHDEFWNWVRVKSKEGHTMFVSEYNAPKDFKCAWSKEINSSLTKNTGGKKGVERLFTI